MKILIKYSLDENEILLEDINNIPKDIIYLEIVQILIMKN